MCVGIILVVGAAGILSVHFGTLDTNLVDASLASGIGLIHNWPLYDIGVSIQRIIFKNQRVLRTTRTINLLCENHISTIFYF